MDVYQNELDTDISNLKAFGDLDRHDFSIIGFFHNEQKSLDIDKDIWPNVKSICTKWKCDYNSFTSRIGIPEKFDGSIIVISNLNPNLGAELVAFYIKKTIGQLESVIYPEIMCAPLKIVTRFRKYQMRQFYNNCKLRKHSETKRDNGSGDNNHQNKERKKTKSRDTDDTITVIVSIAKPLDYKTEQLVYLPKKNVLKKRKIGKAPEYGTKAYKNWYKKKFPPLPNSRL